MLFLCCQEKKKKSTQEVTLHNVFQRASIPTNPYRFKGWEKYLLWDYLWSFINKDGNFNDECCHFCHRLEANEVLEEGKNKPCGPGFWPNQKQTQCELIHNIEDDIPNYDRTSKAVITVDILSFLFLLVIMAFSVLFFIKRNDPIVSKSGKCNEVSSPV